MPNHRGQQAFDTETSADGAYVFDEMGLISYDTSGGKLLTHVIFILFRNH